MKKKRLRKLRRQWEENIRSVYVEKFAPTPARRRRWFSEACRKGEVMAGWNMRSGSSYVVEVVCPSCGRRLEPDVRASDPPVTRDLVCNDCWLFVRMLFTEGSNSRDMVFNNQLHVVHYSRG